MPITADNNTFLPKDLLLQIAPYLTPDELARFSLVCRQFNLVGCTDALWQPFLNRLHALDNSCPVTPPLNANPNWRRFAFIANFKRISMQQMEDISRFQKLSADKKSTISLFSKIDSPAKTLAELEQRQHYLSIAQGFLDEPFETEEHTAGRNSLFWMLTLNPNHSKIIKKITKNIMKDVHIDFNAAPTLITNSMSPSPAEENNDEDTSSEEATNSFPSAKKSRLQ